MKPSCIKEVVQAPLKTLAKIKTQELSELIGGLHTTVHRDEFSRFLFSNIHEDEAYTALIEVAKCHRTTLQHNTDTSFVQTLVRDWRRRNLSADEICCDVEKWKRVFHQAVQIAREFDLDLSDGFIRSYCLKWGEAGYSLDLIKEAYSRAVRRKVCDPITYTDIILIKWNAVNIHTAEDAREKDPYRSGSYSQPRKESIYQTHTKATLTPLERMAVASALEEDSVPEGTTT